MSTVVINQRHEQVAVEKLTPHPRNPRKGDVEAIRQSIVVNGFYGVLVAQRSTRHILVGNHRYQAAVQAGIERVPVVWVDVDDEAALRILLADNRTNDLATYDDKELGALLEELLGTDLGLAGTGYLTTPDDAEGDPQGPLDDPSPTVPEVAQKKWKVKLGDVWTAGGQLITCGDSADPTVYHRLGLADAAVDMVFTDPPYGVAYVGGTDDKLSIENDDLDAASLFKLLTDVFNHAERVTRPGGAWYVACPAGDLHHVFLEQLLTRKILRQSIVWVKDTFVMGRSDYHWRHEPILYGWKPGAKHYFAPGDRTQDTVWEMAAVPEDTVWRFPKPKANREHPTMKPVDLVAKAIRNSTKQGEAVLDPFSGAGSTVLACHQLKRRGYAIELDPKYVAVTLDRFEALGLTPERCD